jgi:hypothetical protein
MNYKDGEAMNPDHIAWRANAKTKLPKKEFLDLFDKSYSHLSKTQAWSFVLLMEKMLEAKQNGENYEVAFRDWNEDGTRRF